MTAAKARAINLVLLLILLGMGAPKVVAQPDDPDFVTITFQPDGITLDEAIRLATEGTGKAFLYSNKRALEGKKLYLTGPQRVRKDKLQEFWQTVFVTQGFAIVPMGPEGTEVQLVEDITTSQLLKQRARYVSVDELESLQRRAGEVIMTSIPLQYVSVANVRQAVTQILQNRQAEFTQEVASANALIVLGFAPTVYAIFQLMKAMDQPSSQITLRLDKIELKYAVAEELQPIIADLIQTAAGGANGQPAVRRTNEATLPGQDKPEPKLIADPRTNSIVVYAVESDLNEIRRLVGFLDTEVSKLESNIRIYYLKNTNADDVSDTLREVLGQSSTRSTGGAGIRGGAGQQASTTASQAGQEVVIVPDGNTNALIISCTRSKYEEIEKIIQELDRRRPQVLVQAAIVELSDSDITSIAVELTGIQGGNPDYGVGAASGFGLSSILSSGDPTVPTTNFLDTIARVPLAVSSGGSFSGLVAGIFQNNLNVPFLVQLLQTTSRGNLVSVPSVLTNDNEQSTIKVGRQVPTVTFSTTAAGTDNNSFGGYEEANLELTISPHISSDGYIRMEIELIVDAFVGAVDVISEVPPPKTTRTFTGSVTVPNGKTVVIGGLVQDNYTESVRKVPLLGDIPVLGHLFRSTSESFEKTTLYLFVTPTIFNTFSQLEQVSYQKKQEIQKLSGNIDLVDPNFRSIDVDDPNLSFEDLEHSGMLDVPRFAPITPQGAADPASLSVEGTPVVPPSSRPGESRAVVPPGGTRTFIRGEGSTSGEGR